jgi:hypothetical protein
MASGKYVLKTRGGKKSFATLTAAAAWAGISIQLVSKRLGKGWTLEEALNLRKHRRPETQGKEIGFQGKLFKSHAALARAYGIRYANFKRRLDLNWTIEECLGLAKHQRSPKAGRTVTTFVNGPNGLEEYPTFKAACEKYGVDRRVAHARKKIGWTTEQALEIESPPSHAYLGFGAIYLITHKKSGRQYVGQTMKRVGTRWELHVKEAKRGGATHLAKAIRRYGEKAFSIETLETVSTRHELNVAERKWIKRNGTLFPAGFNAASGGSGNVKGTEVAVNGRTFKSVSDAAVQHDADPKRVFARLKAGWTLERALSAKADEHIREVVINGKRFRSLRQAAKHFKVGYPLAFRRVRSGWPIEEALGIVPHAINSMHWQSVSVAGKQYRSLSDAARVHGIPVMTAKFRLRNGWEPEEAFGLKQRQRRNQRSVTVKGKRFQSMSEAARTHGIPLSAVQVRLKLGWDISKAFTKPVRTLRKRR